MLLKDARDVRGVSGVTEGDPERRGRILWAGVAVSSSGDRDQGSLARILFFYQTLIFYHYASADFFEAFCAVFCYCLVTLETSLLLNSDITQALRHRSMQKNDVSTEKHVWDNFYDAS